MGIMALDIGGKTQLTPNVYRTFVFVPSKFGLIGTFKERLTNVHKCYGSLERSSNNFQTFGERSENVQLLAGPRQEWSTVRTVAGRGKKS